MPARLFGGEPSLRSQADPHQQEHHGHLDEHAHDGGQSRPGRRATNGRFPLAPQQPDRVLSDYLHRRAAELTLQYGYRYFAVLRTPRRPTHLDTATVGGRTEPEHTIVVEAASRGTLFMPIQCFRDAPQSPDMPLIDAKTYLEKSGPRP